MGVSVSYGDTETPIEDPPLAYSLPLSKAKHVQNDQQAGCDPLRATTGPASPASSNSNIEAVARQFSVRMGRALSGVSFSEQDGTVLLDGTAPSYYAKQMAQECVWQALGSNTAVVNRVSVQE
jgi:hypothetical protein